MIDRQLRAILLAACALACTAVTTLRAAPAGAAEAPNVLFIAIDDLNDWIGCLEGHPQAMTPNIDRLAARGVLFTNAHCAAPACNPSRAAVFSGRMPWNTGVWSNQSPRLLKQHPDMTVLPRAFSQAGYVTLGTGKLLHSRSANKVLFDRSYNPEQRWSPFTREQVRYTWQELPTKGTDNPRHVIRREGRDPVVLPLNRMPSDRKPETTDGESFDWGPLDVADSEMGDTQITDWAIDQLQGGFDKPFFLGVGYYRPHIPLWAPRKYFLRFAAEDEVVKLPAVKEDDLADLSSIARRWAIEPITAGRHSTVVRHNQWSAAVKAYLACTSFVDHQVGRLLDGLDEAGFGENTLIVLWTDHGWHLGEKQHWGKWTGWERSTRVPLIVAGPKNLKSEFAKGGSRCDRPVSLVDLYPTLAELCHVAAPDGLDGRSLAPLLRDPDRPTGGHRPKSAPDTQSVRGTGKVGPVVTTFDPGNVTLRTDRWRYIRYADGSEELYDHQRDPNEWDNLAGEPGRASLLDDLRSRVPEAARRSPNPPR